MTLKLVVLYTQPDDPEAFEKEYLERHARLVEAIGGMLRWEGARVVSAADGGEQTYFRMAELYFADEAALQSALSSDAGKATAADYERIAPPGSRLFIASVE